MKTQTYSILEPVFRATVFLAAALLLSSCGQEAAKPAEATEIRNGEVLIGYSDCGDSDTTLLFIHGWCIDKSYWSYQADYFCDRYRVVLVDLPGFGSPAEGRTEWTIEQFGSDIAAVIADLDLRKVVLIGHSMGGAVALEAAATYPDRIIGFVGVDNFKGIGRAIDADQRKELDEFIALLRDSFVQVSTRFADNYLLHENTPQEVRDRLYTSIGRTDPGIGAAAARSNWLYQERELAQLAVLPVKLQLINSNATPTDTAALGRYCAHSYRVYSAGLTGHYPMLEDPDRFNQALDSILLNL